MTCNKIKSELIYEVNNIISHDLEFLSRVATKAVFIENNTVSKRINLKKSDEFETIKRFLLQSEGYEE